MLKLLVYLLFILSVASASAGIALASRLRNIHKAPFFSTLLYFQVFIFTFGFYGIWGQLVIKSFLSDLVTAESVARFSNISLLLGLPFLVFAWLMLIKFSLEITGRRVSNWFVYGFLFMNFLIIIVVGYLMSGRPVANSYLSIKNLFIILNSLYTTVSSAILFIIDKRGLVLLRKESRITGTAIILLMACQCVLLFFYETEPFIGLLFILIFFAGNPFLPVYLSYGTKMNLSPEQKVSDIPFNDFCSRFEISPRESEIIAEICNGLSNKEISEKLFISLQTVKDHTHRIYIKTNVKSRAQLMNMVKGVGGLR
jgi:DNA-binding CsgD family transcriptional regulator